jgi:hypothetical protein
MPVLICPECGAENLPDAETCAVCQASLLGVEPADPGQPSLTPRMNMICGSTRR